MRKLSARFLAFTLLVSVSANADQKPPLRLSVAQSLQETMLTSVVPELEKRTGRKVEFLAAKSTAPIHYANVLEGKAEAAFVSFPYDEWLKVTREDGVKIPLNNPITFRTVGKALIKIIANKGNGVARLTRTQLSDVFSGAAKSWKAVGGRDVPVQVLMTMDKKSGREYFRKAALKDRDFSPSAIQVPTSAELLNKLETSEGTIAFMPDKPILKTAIYVQIDPIGKPITLITNGKPTADIDVLIRLLREYYAANN